MENKKNEIVHKPETTEDSLTYAAVEDPDQKQGSQVLFQQDWRNSDEACLQGDHNDDISAGGYQQLVTGLSHHHHCPQVASEDLQDCGQLPNLETRKSADRQHQSQHMDIPNLVQGHIIHLEVAHHDAVPRREDDQGELVHRQPMVHRLQEVMQAFIGAGTCATHSSAKTDEVTSHCLSMAITISNNVTPTRVSKHIGCNSVTGLNSKSVPHLSNPVNRLDKASFTIREVLAVCPCVKLSMLIPRSQSRRRSEGIQIRRMIKPVVLRLNGTPLPDNWPAERMTSIPSKSARLTKTRGDVSISSSTAVPGDEGQTRQEVGNDQDGHPIQDVQLFLIHQQHQNEENTRIGSVKAILSETTLAHPVAARDHSVKDDAAIPTGWNLLTMQPLSTVDQRYLDGQSTLPARFIFYTATSIFIPVRHQYKDSMEEEHEKLERQELHLGVETIEADHDQHQEHVHHLCQQVNGHESPPLQDESCMVDQRDQVKKMNYLPKDKAIPEQASSRACPEIHHCVQELHLEDHCLHQQTRSGLKRTKSKAKKVKVNLESVPAVAQFVSRLAQSTSRSGTSSRATWLDNQMLGSASAFPVAPHTVSSTTTDDHCLPVGWKARTGPDTTGHHHPTNHFKASDATSKLRFWHDCSRYMEISKQVAEKQSTKLTEAMECVVCIEINIFHFTPSNWLDTLLRVMPDNPYNVSIPSGSMLTVPNLITGSLGVERISHCEPMQFLLHDCDLPHGPAVSQRQAPINGYGHLHLAEVDKEGAGQGNELLLGHVLQPIQHQQPGRDAQAPSWGSDHFQQGPQQVAVQVDHVCVYGQHHIQQLSREGQGVIEEISQPEQVQLELVGGGQVPCYGPAHRFHHESLSPLHC